MRRPVFFYYNHRYFKVYNIYGYNTSLVFHLESSNENVKYVWSQVTQMRVIEMKNKCHKTPGASIPPETMMHFPPLFQISPPISEKFLNFLKILYNFTFSRKIS